MQPYSNFPNCLITFFNTIGIFIEIKLNLFINIGEISIFNKDKYVYLKMQIFPFTYLILYPSCMCAQSLNLVRLFVTPWTVTHHVSLSIGFFRQEQWNWLPFPLPGHLLNSGIKPEFPESPALAGRFLTAELPECIHQCCLKVFSYRFASLVRVIISYFIIFVDIVSGTFLFPLHFLASYIFNIKKLLIYVYFCTLLPYWLLLLFIAKILVDFLGFLERQPYCLQIIDVFLLRCQLLNF